MWHRVYIARCHMPYMGEIIVQYAFAMG